MKKSVKKKTPKIYEVAYQRSNVPNLNNKETKTRYPFYFTVNTTYSLGRSSQ